MFSKVLLRFATGPQRVRFIQTAARAVSGRSAHMMRAAVLCTATLGLAMGLQENQKKQLLFARGKKEEPKKEEKLAPKPPVTEPQTGIVFEGTLNETEMFVGCGCRKKFGLAKIYAVGLYVNAQARKAIAAGLKGDALMDAIANGNFRKTVVLKMYRDVTPQQIVDALEGALLPRIKAKGGSEDTMKDFRTAVMSVGPKLPNGTELKFICEPAPANAMKIIIGGKDLGEIKNVAPLCWAMLDVYVGKEAVAPEIRGNIEKSFANWA